MIEEEIAKTADAFKQKVTEEFAFLVTAAGYSGPADKSFEYEYGFKLSYTSPKGRVEIVNQYHPYDYGFEVNVITTAGDKTKVFYKLKEDQEDNLSFITEGARALQTYLGHMKSVCDSGRV